jgi:hypothetical protein
MAAEHNWMDTKWRPAMAWLYMAICITDFILFPIAWAVFQAHVGQSVQAWEPLTLGGAGLFHMAMGAVLGITAWSRGQEKLAGVAVSEDYGRREYRPPSKGYYTRHGTRVPYSEEPEL